jgi:ribosome-binding factor A
MSAIRNDRLNEEIKKVISEIIRDMKDPRISPMCTVMNTETTPDLMYTKVNVSIYDEQAAREETVAALNHAASFISGEIGKRMKIRRLPKLTFVLDSSIEYSLHIAKLIDEINKVRKETD